MSKAVVEIMAKRFETMAAALTTEQLQEEYNRRSLHFAWIVKQAQEYADAELEPFASELRKRTR